MAMATCTICKKMSSLSQIWPPVCEKCKPNVANGIDTSKFHPGDSLVIKNGELEVFNGDHHPCGPSSLYRRQMCPGSMKAEEGLPEVESEYSEEGTLLHSAVWIEHDREQLNIDQLKILSFADSALEKIAAKYGVKEWHGETRVKLSHGRWGTVDCWGYAADCSIIIIDFKFGYKEVSAPSSNLQLADYATGIVRHVDDSVEKVTACIVQPRVMGSKWSEFTFTMFRLIERNIKEIIDNCNKPNAPFCAGDWCTYCKKFESCNKVEEMTESISKVEPTAITVSNADEMYEKACLVEKKIKAIKAQCKQLTIDNGGRAGRLEIREKKGNRFIPDLQKAYEAVQDLMSVDEFLSCCSANMGKLETSISSRLKDQGKVKTLIEGKERFNELVGVKNKKTTTEIKLNKE